MFMAWVLEDATFWNTQEYFEHVQRQTNQERFEVTRATMGNLIPVGMSVLTAEFGKRRVGEPIRLRPCTFFQ